jgi:hypothetical protein
VTTEGETNVTYEQALKRGERSGANRAGEQEFLALVCKSLASLHAISPALVYEGAKKRRLTAKQVAKLAEDDPVALRDLMFV